MTQTYPVLPFFLKKMTLNWTKISKMMAKQPKNSNKLLKIWVKIPLVLKIAGNQLEKMRKLILRRGNIENKVTKMSFGSGKNLTKEKQTDMNTTLPSTICHKNQNNQLTKSTKSAPSNYLKMQTTLLNSRLICKKKW